ALPISRIRAAVGARRAPAGATTTYGTIWYRKGAPRWARRPGGSSRAHPRRAQVRVSGRSVHLPPQRAAAETGRRARTTAHQRPGLARRTGRRTRRGRRVRLGGHHPVTRRAPTAPRQVGLRQLPVGARAGARHRRRPSADGHGTPGVLPCRGHRQLPILQPPEPAVLSVLAPPGIPATVDHMGGASGSRAALIPPV